MAVSYTHLDVYKRQGYIVTIGYGMQYLGLTGFNERGNSSLKISWLTLRLWVYRYDRLWHAVLWYESFNGRGNGFVNDRQVDIAVMGNS